MVEFEQVKNILTTRELEVLRLIAQGFKTREISELLSISFETVRSHRKNIIHKYEARNIIEAIFKATQLNKIKLLK